MLQTVSVSEAILTITPQFMGSATLTITASDGLLTTTQTFFVTVTGNQSPVVVGTIPAQTLIVGGPAAAIKVSNYFSDPDGDVLTYHRDFSGSGRGGCRAAYYREHCDHTEEPWCHDTHHHCQ